MLSQLTPINANTWRTPTEPNYGTFVGAFGGWTCASCVMVGSELLGRSLGPDAGQPLALTINFIAAVPPGFVQVQATVVAATKSTSHVAVTVCNEQANGEADPVPAATASLVFAKRRPSEAIAGVPMPAAPPAQSVARSRFANAQVSWPSQYEHHTVLGVPFQHNAQMRSLTWTRYADALPLNFARLAAMADASLPRIYFYRDAVVPISTVTMTVQFHCDELELAAVGNDFVLVEALSHSAGHGFFDQHVRIFAHGGQLLATSTQMVWFKALTGQATQARNAATRS
jgi:Thioesterase-like superfamily